MTTQEPHRTPKTRSNQRFADTAFDQRLLVYALAAGATLAWSARSQAEVIFTPSSAVLQGLGKFDIDLDHDGSADFSIQITWVHYYYHELVPGLVAYGNRPSHQIVARHGEALPLKNNTHIGGGRPFRALAVMETAIYSGLWKGVSNRFLGVRFLINGEVHYGWIGFRGVHSYPIAAKLAGWAYETEPNKEILAGDMGTSAPLDSSFSPTSLEILASGHAAIEQRRKRNTP